MNQPSLEIPPAAGSSEPDKKERVRITPEIAEAVKQHRAAFPAASYSDIARVFRISPSSVAQILVLGYQYVDVGDRTIAVPIRRPKGGANAAPTAPEPEPAPPKLPVPATTGIGIPVPPPPAPRTCGHCIHWGVTYTRDGVRVVGLLIPPSTPGGREVAPCGRPVRKSGIAGLLGRTEPHGEMQAADGFCDRFVRK